MLFSPVVHAFMTIVDVLFDIFTRSIHLLLMLLSTIVNVLFDIFTRSIRLLLALLSAIVTLLLLYYSPVVILLPSIAESDIFSRSFQPHNMANDSYAR